MRGSLTARRRWITTWSCPVNSTWKVLRLRTGDMVVLRSFTQSWVIRGDIFDAAFEVNSSPLEPIYPA